MSITQDRLSSLHGADVYDRNGDKIGSVGQLYADHAGQPTWASVKTGLFGMNESLVPLAGAQWQNDRLEVAYDKATVKDAPNVDADTDEPLQSDEIGRLYQHYNLSWDDSYGAYQAGSAATTESYSGTESHSGTEYSGTESYSGTEYSGATAGTAGTYATDTDRSGTTDNAMTRSEEQLRVGTERQAVGTARLRKYVVTDHVQTTVPVQREEVRVEREAITEGNRGDAFSGPELTESEHEVTLHAERPVVDTETVPVERVRLDTAVVTEEQTVGGEVRKEQIEADIPDDQGRRNFG